MEWNESDNSPIRPWADSVISGRDCGGLEWFGFFDMMRSFARRFLRGQNLTKSPSDLASDLVLRELQDSKIANTIRNLPNCRAVEMFIHEVMKNHLLSYLRVRQAAKRGGQLRRIPLNGLDVMSEPGLDPAFMIDFVELLHKLETDAVEDMRCAGRIIRLEFYENLSQKDISVRLEISTTMVWRFRQSGLTRIRKQLEDLADGQKGVWRHE